MSSWKQRKIIQELADRRMFVSATTYAHSGTFIAINTGTRVRTVPVSIAGEMLRRIKQKEWNQIRARFGAWRVRQG